MDFGNININATNSTIRITDTKRTNEEILDKIQETAEKESALEEEMDRMLYACKADTQEFREVYEKHLELYGVMQGLRWVLGFVDDKHL